ncbi:MAG: S-methyl-5-thioribose-1-phosphate isomerase [Gammaproteobacteria bacterium]|nr:S-methyl-5-thioribose-1-phosphate isomerase [Gammaproteobacteria bacterium]
MSEAEQGSDSVRAVQWEQGRLKLLDQRILPLRQTYLYYDNVVDVAEAITQMVVRGAPAIGIAAAYGVVVAAMRRIEQSPDHWKTAIEADLDLLARSRPTAVNLFWALEKMREAITACDDDPSNASSLADALLVVARRIHQEDIAACQRMGELGAELISAGGAVLTHCNAGALATGGYGTALGVVRAAYATGKIEQVYADETRPWMQGARLTAWELNEDGIPVTLIVEGAAGHLMKQGEVSWVITGADRIAANGDAANKIGTYNLAIIARRHGVKMMVVAPTSTVDMAISDGDAIPIEMRSPDEILQHNGQSHVAAGVSAWNPAFDVTPAALIDAIVTERGVVMAPDAEKMAAMMAAGG